MGVVQRPDELQRVIEQQVAGAGLADIEAGRYTTVVTPEDSRLLQERLMERLQTRLAVDG